MEGKLSVILNGDDGGDIVLLIDADVNVRLVVDTAVRQVEHDEVKGIGNGVAERVIQETRGING